MSAESATERIRETKNGYYYGTEKGAWWRRYHDDGWLSRGNSEMWVTRQGLYFRRYLSKQVLHIPRDSMEDVTIGKWHAGKWTGAPVIKIVWKHKGLLLVSGFSVSRDHGETERWIWEIKQLLGAR